MPDVEYFPSCLQFNVKVISHLPEMNKQKIVQTANNVFLALLTCKAPSDIQSISLKWASIVG